MTGTTRKRAAPFVTLAKAAPGFRHVWDKHEAGFPRTTAKRFRHPAVGALELHCQVLHDSDQQQMLLVFTATAGSESYEGVPR